MEAVYARQRLKKLQPVIREYFRQINVNNDGQIKIGEITNAIESGIPVPAPLKDYISPASMLDLFDALDLDGSGELNEHEFTEGLSHLALTVVPIEQTQMLHLQRAARREILRTHDAVEGMDQTIGAGSIG